MSGPAALNIYSKSLSQSESPFSSRHQANQSLTNCPILPQNSSPISQNNGINLIAKNTPTSIKQQQYTNKEKQYPQHQQNQLQQALQASSILTTYPNSSCEGSSCGSSIKPLNGNNALSRQMSKQLSRHQLQTSNGSTCEQSELRSFFSDNQHFLSNNHFSGMSAEEREQQHNTQMVPQNSLQVSHFNYQPPSGYCPSQIAQQTIENNSQEVLSTCPMHQTKKVKYQMSDRHQDKFCSNCAVEFARQGYGIQEISKTPQPNRMDIFMGEVKNVKALSDMLMGCFNTKISSIREYCLDQAKKVNDFFVLVEREIYSQKTALLTVINDRMWEAINVLESKKNEAKILEKRFLRNEADILRNRKKIVEEMEEAEVSSILKYYQQELDQAKQSLNEIFTGTSFQLASMDQHKLTNDPSFLKKVISKEIFQPILLTSSLSNPVLFNPAQVKPSSSTLQNEEKPNKNIITAQVITSRRQDSKQRFEPQLPQPEIEHQRIVDTAGDSSMSEKQQTQESEDLSMIPNLLQNESKISNKSNISSNKIISYTDLHYQPLRDNHNNKINQNHENYPPNKILDPFKQPTSNIKSIQYAYQSPPNSQKSEGLQFISTHKIDQQGMAHKYRQAAQTEPTHLPCNKFKQILQGNPVATNSTGYQRNLMINEEATQGNTHQSNNQNNPKIKTTTSQATSKSYMAFQ